MRFPLKSTIFGWENTVYVEKVCKKGRTSFELNKYQE